MSFGASLKCAVVLSAALAGPAVAEVVAPTPLTNPAELSLVRPLAVADSIAPPGSGGGTAVPSGEEPGLPPLMSLLDQAGLARPLEDARIDLYGHIEVGYTRNFKHPPVFINGGQNFGRVFDIVDNEVVMNQLDLNIERRVDPSNKQWDLGGRAELLYGTDATFTHALGLGEHFNPKNVPDYEFDPLQLYLDLAVPVGNGLRVRAGRFVYFYAIDPNENVFYSHGFAFNGAFSKTLTGVSGEYKVNDQLDTEAGISLGAGQALRNVNNDINVFGRVTYKFTEDTRLTVRGIVGPEQPDDSGHYRYAMDVVLSQRFSDNLTLVVNPVFGFQPHGELQTIVGNQVVDVFHDAYWYGVAGTAVLKIDRHFSLGGRAEVYRDDGRFTTGFNVWLFETTFGLTITPFPDDKIGSNFKVRPEVRYDYASERVFDGRPAGFFGEAPIGNPQHDQFTFGIDAIFNF